MKYINILGLALLAFAVLHFVAPQEPTVSNIVAQVVTIDVDASGKIQLNGQDLTMSELSSSLESMSMKVATYAVVEVSPDMPMGLHHDLMGELRRSNISGVSYEEANGGKGIEFYKLTN